MVRREHVFVGIAGESLSNRTTSRLGTGLFRSPVDRLGEWEDLSPRLCDAPEVRAITVAPDDSATIYVGTQQGVHVTTDGGDTWRLLGAPRPEFGVWSIAVSRAAPDVIFAGYDPNAIHRSADRGRTWTPAAMPADYPASTDPEVKRIMSLACDPADDRRIYAAIEVGGVLRSDDGGRSFTRSAATDDVDPLDLHAIGVSGAGVIAVGRDGSFLSADHGRTFTRAADDSVWLGGLERRALEEIIEAVSREHFGGNVYARRIDAEGGGLRVALGARRASRDDYGGAFDPQAAGARRNAEGRIEAAACAHAVARVIDAAYRRHARGDDRSEGGLQVATPFARFADAAEFRARAGIALGAPCECNRPDGGARADFVRAARGWLMVEQYCRSLAVASPDVLYIGAGASWLAEHGTLYRSDDGGRSVRALELPDGIDSTIFGAAVAPADVRRVAAASKNGQVLVSLDEGASWRMARLPAEGHPVYALAVT